MEVTPFSPPYSKGDVEGEWWSLWSSPGGGDLMEVTPFSPPYSKGDVEGDSAHSLNRGQDYSEPRYLKIFTGLVVVVFPVGYTNS